MSPRKRTEIAPSKPLQQSATKLENASKLELAEDQARNATNRLKILADASMAFAAAGNNYQAVLDLVVRQVSDALADMCQIRLISDNGELLELVAIYSQDPEQAMALQTEKMDESSVPVNDPGWIPHVLRTGEPAFVPVITAEQLKASIPPKYWSRYERFAPHSYLIVPLSVKGRNIGVMSLTRSRNDLPAFTKDDLRLAQDLAGQAALVISNAHLFDQIQAELFERTKAEKKIIQMKRLYATLS